VSGSGAGEREAKSSELEAPSKEGDSCQSSDFSRCALGCNR